MDLERSIELPRRAAINIEVYHPFLTAT